MADETIIIKVEVDNSQAIASAAKAKSAIDDLKGKQKELNQARKDGLISDKAYYQGSTVLDAALKQQKETYSKLSNEIAGTKSWTDKLKDSFSSNQQVADKLTGGIAGTAQGIVGMTKASIAFIATPIGLVIGALGIAIASLTAYFKGSEEGQNKWNNIMTIGSVIMEKFTDVLEAFGAAIFNATQNTNSWKDVLTNIYNFVKDNLINRFTAFAVVIEGLVNLDFKKVTNGVLQFSTGISNVIEKSEVAFTAMKKTFDEAIAEATILSGLQVKIDKEERAMIAERARVNFEVAKLRIEAIQVEGEEKRRLTQEAIDLLQSLADKEVDLANLRLAQAQQELVTNGATKEALDLVETARAAVINADAQRFEQTVRFQKELEALEAAEVKRAKDLADAKIKIQREAWTEEQRILAAEAAAFDKQLVDDKKRKTSEIEIAQSVTKAKIDLAGQLGGTLSALSEQSKELGITGVIIQKASAIGQIIASTAIANAKAIAASPLTLGMPWVAINTSSAVISSISTIAEAAKAISQISAAAGGGSFMTRGPSLMMVGDNPGGVERVDVTPISGVGTTVVGGSLSRFAGGGSVISDGGLNKNMGVSAVNDQMLLMNMFKHMPAPVSSWKEFTELDAQIKTKMVATTA